MMTLTIVGRHPMKESTNTAYKELMIFTKKLARNGNLKTTLETLFEFCFAY